MTSPPAISPEAIKRPVADSQYGWQGVQFEQLNPAKDFKSLCSAKVTLQAIDAFRANERDYLREPKGNARAELHLIETLFVIAT